MIDIIDDMVKKAGRVLAFGGRVYRSYPQLLDRMSAFAVVNPAGRQTLLSDDDGSEILVSLTYVVSIFDETPEAVDDRFRELTSIYNNAHIQNAGYSPAYQTTNNMYTAQATYTARVDRRGFVYAR